jgi:hypothetical protein
MIQPMKRTSRSAVSCVLLLFECSVYICLCLATPDFVSAQTPPLGSQSTGVLRLKVKPKVNGKDKELSRKRFFLINGSLEENRTLVEKINQQSLPTRDCYYRNAKASAPFVNWLNEGDCESVYCRFLTGPEAVPEFQAAYERSVKEYKTPELGRLWLTTNLTNEIRDGFYRLKRTALKALIGDAETATGTSVNSVMTDRKGTAYFTDVAPGTYLVSNLLPTELGDKTVIWTCEVKIGSGEKRLQIPNIRDKNVKCIVNEKPLPACDSGKQTASNK